MARVRKTGAIDHQPQLPFDAKVSAKIDAKLAVIGAGVAKRRGRPPRVTKPGDALPVTQEQKMAWWNDLVMGVPNDLIRCALFAATDCEDQRALNRERIAAHEGVTVTYTGWELTQSHLDVFEAIMQNLRGQEADNVVHFNRSDVLRIIGRDDGGYDHQWVHKRIIELMANTVEIVKNRRKGFAGALITESSFDILDGTYSVILQRQLIQLFKDGFTKVQWEQRKALQGKYLACWLHMYYCSHRNPFPVTVAFLKEQCGSKTPQLKHFKQYLIKALNDLESADVIGDWDIAKDGMVSVKKPLISRRKAA